MNKPIATISRTNEILKKFDLRAKKGFGQNFITEPSIVGKIADLSQCQGKAVIEIGPGIGALTEQLALRAKQVITFEIDERLPSVLAYTLEPYQNVEIRLQDFLETDLLSLVDSLQKQYDDIVLCANLPYYITTPLLFKIFESKTNISIITVMMQKEVADRMAAQVNTKDYNALSILVQFYYEVKSVMKVPRSVFHPRPNVDSAVVQFIRRETLLKVSDEKQFTELVKACFKQRRKTIYNNLRDYLKDQDLALDLLIQANIDPQSRAENSQITDFVRLSEVYYERKGLC